MVIRSVHSCLYCELVFKSLIQSLVLYYLTYHGQYYDEDHQSEYSYHHGDDHYPVPDAVSLHLPHTRGKSEGVGGGVDNRGRGRE